MTLFAANDKLLYFAHIPKTGGTTISAAVQEAGAVQAMWSPRRLAGMKCPPQHLHVELRDQLLPADLFDASVAAVRNPYDRIASEYLYFRQFKRGRLWPFNLWVRWVVRRFSSDPYVRDNHIRPQVHFVDDAMEVFRFEDGLQPVVDHACALLSLHTSATGHRNPSTGHTLAASTDTVELIRRFYAADFDAFGYDPDQVPDRLSG